MLLSFIVSSLYSTRTVEIVERALWTLTFAAQLVLLMVMLGRDRMRRYPWFTACIALYALRLMAEVLLSGRMAMLPYSVIILSLANLTAIVGLLLLVEVARRAFAGLRRPLWIVNSMGLLAVACGVLAVWGPWPVWKDMALNTTLGKLRLMQLTVQKGEMLAALITVGLGLLVVFFGRRFKAGWRSHAQMIVIGLMAVAVAGLAIQLTVQHIVKTVHPHTRQEYDNILGLIANLVNSKKLVYVAALFWWIVWLWKDEPGAAKLTELPLNEEPPLAGE
jgi:hypothetical protein